MANKVTMFLKDKLLLTWRGVIKENPTFVLVLGMCPTLGTTTSAENGFGMGVATMAVLIMSNIVISLIKNLIPDKVRIPAFIVVIASFVTVIQMLMEAFVPSLYASLGVFIPLIVVNCIILGRAEAFACKNGVIDSLADGLGAGVGFTLALALIASVREIVGAGSLTVWGDIAIKNIYSDTVVLAILPAGGFIILGLLLAAINHIGAVQARRRGEPPPLPVNLDCRHCTMCPAGK